MAVTSETETLWDNFHTARKRNESRPGVKHVDGDSLYRIASITKTFTVLGILYQYQAGRLELDAPISKYIPELRGSIIPVGRFYVWDSLLQTLIAVGISDQILPLFHSLYSIYLLTTLCFGSSGTILRCEYWRVSFLAYLETSHKVMC